MDQRGPGYQQWQAPEHQYASQHYAPQHASQGPPYQPPMQFGQRIRPTIMPGLPPDNQSNLHSRRPEAHEILPAPQQPRVNPAPLRHGNHSPIVSVPSGATTARTQTPATRALAPRPPGMTHGEQDQQMSDAAEDEDEDNLEPIYQLPPPPENKYANDRECDQAMHAWSLEHGYELVRRASKKNAKGQLYKRYYHCSKHGKLANTGKLTDQTRVRLNRKSNRIGCPMSLAVIALDPGNPDGPWEIRHRKVHHNHGPLEGLALAGHRRRARMGGVEKAVDGLFAIGTPTAQVLQFLERTNPDGLFTRTDVANMKLKYKKYGTCIGSKGAVQNEQRGLPSACMSCRQKKVKCDSSRPSCTACGESGIPCQYDHEPTDARPTLEHDLSVVTNNSVIEPVNDEPPLASTAVPPPLEPQQSNTRMQVILSDLQAFQANHVQPTRLTLQSSVVEVLAATTCGRGDSYRSVKPLENPGQWQTFKDAMNEAALKENTHEVLFGLKLEPITPDENHTVEEWNEYIKQLAIFNRRNAALMGALLPKIGHSFRPRVDHLSKAAEVMQALEDLCRPRGSDQALNAWTQLHSTTLQSCNNLQDYIVKLETSFIALNRFGAVKTGQPPAKDNSRRQSVYDRWKNPSSSNGKGPVFPMLTTNISQGRVRGDIYPEWALCFHFLHNLGPDYKLWAEHLCMTNNVGGFGTGQLLEFAELTRLALEQEKVIARRHVARRAD